MRCVAVDVQPKMIGKLKQRLGKAGLASRVDARVAPAESMGLTDLKGAVDFTVALYVVHEFPEHSRFFAEVAEASKPGATLLLAEPKGHVKATVFEAQLKAAAQAGFVRFETPTIRRSLTALLKKS